MSADRTTCRLPCLPEEGPLCLGCALAYAAPEVEERDTDEGDAPERATIWGLPEEERCPT